MSQASALQLLHEITHCPAVAACRRGAVDHPCSEVVGTQDGTEDDAFHMPEPWSGFLRGGDLLFVSSNPSLSEDENYPNPLWSSDAVDQYFNARFDGAEGHIKDNRSL